MTNFRHMGRAAAIAVTTVLLAAVMTVDAIVGVSATADPNTALSLSPQRGEALVARGRRQLLSAAPDPATYRAMSRDAELAIRQSPINAGAVMLKGVARDSLEGSEAARPLMVLARKLTRRDLPVQLWWIETDSAGGDVAATLDHYDIAMTTNSSAQAILFPILTDALSQQEIRTGLANLFRRRPAWMPALVQHLIVNAQVTGDVVDLIIAGGGLPDGKAYAGLAPHLISQLAVKREFAALARFYSHLPGTNAAMLQSAELSRAGTDPRHVPASWEMLPQDGPVAAVETGNDDTRLLRLDDFLDTATPAARKLLLLRPGPYHVELESKQVDPDAPTAATIAVQCADAITTSVLASDMLAGRSWTRNELAFDVPPSCPAVYLLIGMNRKERAGGGVLVRNIRVRR
jgi:hypothetical protein